MTKQSNRLCSLLSLGLLVSFLASACMDTSIPNEEAQTDAPTTEESSPVSQTSPSPLGEVNSSEVALALDGEGFQLVEPQAEGTGRVNFGESLNDAAAAVSSVLGQPAITAEMNAECPAGPMEFTSWGNGFILNAINGELVGWSVRSHNAANTPLATDKGIGIGTPRETLESAYSTTVTETTLGTEFYTDDLLSGILSSDAPDATVESLWAGTACNFR